MGMNVNADAGLEVEPRNGLWHKFKTIYGRTFGWLEGESREALCMKSIAYPALAAGTGLLCYYVASYGCDQIGKEYKDLSDEKEFDYGTKIGLTVVAVGTVVLDLLRPRSFKKSSLMFLGATSGAIIAIHKKVAKAELQLETWNSDVQGIRDVTRATYWQNCLRRIELQPALFTNPVCSTCLEVVYDIQNTFLSQIWTNPNFQETFCQDPNYEGNLDWYKWPSSLTIDYTPGPIDNPGICDPVHSVWSGTSVSNTDRDDYFDYLHRHLGYTAPMNVNITLFLNDSTPCVTMNGTMSLIFPIWSWCMDGASQISMPPRKPYPLELPCATNYFTMYFNEYKQNVTNMAFFLPLPPAQAVAITESDLKKSYMYVGIPVCLLFAGGFVVSCIFKPSCCTNRQEEQIGLLA